jgi:hypothetical protein
MAVTTPRGLELRPEGHEGEHRQARHAIDHPVEELQRGRVRPLQILVHGEDHLPLGELLDSCQLRLCQTG